MSENLAAVIAYHQGTKHQFHAYAPGPGRLSWATQPDPFRRYAGAPLVPLAIEAPDSGPDYEMTLAANTISPAVLDAGSLSRLFFDSLALSAWKSSGGQRWALRVNPSSGNLHPTEGYWISGAVAGVSERPFVAHYAPREHALEIRAELPDPVWAALSTAFPAALGFVGLASIHWREAWKYGERAYRYCQHDCGHAIATVTISAAALGWRAVLVDSLSRDELALLLGVADAHGVEPEEPDCLLAILPRDGDVPPRFRPHLDWDGVRWRGRPNALSPRRVHWPMIEQVTRAARKPASEAALPARMTANGEPGRAASDESVSLRTIIHQRRSAVSFDGRTGITAAGFYGFLDRTRALTSRSPYSALPWEPYVHLVLFVHRVKDLEPGLYLFVRNRRVMAALRAAAMRPGLAWTRPESCPEHLDLVRLGTGDARALATRISCHQEIAGDGCFSLGMLAELESPLRDIGPWFYPRLFWECGMIGQTLYLEAEAIGIRGTGIGCFFDDPMHEVLGLSGLGFQSLYHFTVGGPVEDRRLTTLPAYPAYPVDENAR